MILRTSKNPILIISGLLFIWYGLIWEKNDLFNESNVEALLKSGIKTEATIMGNFKDRKQLVPSIGYMFNIIFLLVNIYIQEMVLIQ
jgi:hypothetical protein